MEEESRIGTLEQEGNALMDLAVQQDNQVSQAEEGGDQLSAVEDELSGNSDNDTGSLLNDKGEPIKEESATPDSEEGAENIDPEKKPEGEIEDTEEDLQKQLDEEIKGEEVETEVVSEEEKPAPTKEEKDLARREKTWKQTEEEKQTARAEIKAEREAFEKEKAEYQAKQAQEQKAQEVTSDDYEKYANKLEDEGEIEQAEQAREAAKDLKVKEKENIEIQKQQAQKQFSDDWVKNENAMIEKFPDLKDTNSALGQKVVAILQSDPRLNQVSDGINIAVKLANSEIAETGMADLQSKYDSLLTENKELKKRTSIDDSGANTRAGTPSSKISLEDEGKQLLAEAQREDQRSQVL